MFARSIQSIGLFVVLSLTDNNTVKKVLSWDVLTPRSTKDLKPYVKIREIPMTKFLSPKFI